MTALFSPLDLKGSFRLLACRIPDLGPLDPCWIGVLALQGIAWKCCGVLRWMEATALYATSGSRRLVRYQDAKKVARCLGIVRDSDEQPEFSAGHQGRS